MARGSQVRSRPLSTLMVIAADIKGKGGGFFLLWMDESKNPQQLLTSLTYIPCAPGRQDLGLGGGDECWGRAFA